MRLSCWVIYPIWRLTPFKSDPLKRSLPAVGRVSPDIMFKSVDFPQPLGPTIVTNSPPATDSDVFSTATMGRSARPANRLVTSTTSNIPIYVASVASFRQIFVRDDRVPWDVALEQAG